MSIPRTLALTGLPALTVLALALAGSLGAAEPSPTPTPTPTPVATPTPAVTAAVSPTPDATPTQTLTPPPAVSRSPFTFSTEPDRGAVLAGGDGLVRVELIIGSEHDPVEGARVPTDLVVVLDTSGSMSGGKIRDARAAAAELVSQLGPEDRFALVGFDSRATVEVPLSLATDRARTRWQRTLRGLDAGGSTNLRAGLQTGAAQLAARAGRAGRTVLISDGLPDSDAGLVGLASAAARAETPLTTVGIGDDYDEHLMSQLADAGTGNFYWVRGGDDLARVFADELSTARESVATGLAVRAHLGDGVQLVDAAGYPVSVEGGSPTFRVGSLYAGQERHLWVTLRLPAGQGMEAIDPGAFELVVSQPDGAVARLDSDLRPVRVEADHRAWVAQVDAGQWERAVVEEQYNAVRGEVSRRVQAGDKEGALSVLGSYLDGVTALNRDVGSALVDDNLAEAADLQQQIQVTEGRDNGLAKSLNEASYLGRRTGQVKAR